jgi:hypothetical protein
LATPILAFAAISACSAARMSGRRSSKDDGMPGGNFRRHFLLHELASADHASGILAEQQTDLILGLLDLLLQRVGMVCAAL